MPRLPDDAPMMPRAATLPGRVRAKLGGGVRRGWTRGRVLAGGRPSPVTRRFVVKGTAGLCNRLWYLLAAKSFCERWGLDLHVEWTEGAYADRGVDAFGTLFELPGVGPPPAADAFGAVFPTLWEGCETQCFYDRRAAREAETGRAVSQDDLMFPFHQVLLGRPAAATLIGAGWSFDAADLRACRASTDARRLAEGLRPVGAAAALVAADLPPAAELNRCVGVHVRRTDAPDQLPLDAYFAAADAVAGGAAGVFLCTDDGGVEEDFREHYGSRLIAVPRFYHADGTNLHHRDAAVPDRGRLAAEAVRDLWGLGGCGTIVHGGNSSFSRFAVAVLADPGATVRLAG